VLVLGSSPTEYEGTRRKPSEKKSKKLNAVEIEEAISALAEQPFDAQEFPFAFLQAFGNKETTIRKLRAGASNKSDLGGVLQTNNIHIAVCPPGEVTKTLGALKASPATAKAKARFTLATDGADFEAEDLETGETVACAYQDFPDHFGFFLPLAGITTVKQVRESSFDIRATSRLNRLYVELLKDNPEWGGPALDLGIALSTSAIATSVPAEAPVTSARLSTTCRFMKSCPPHKVTCLSPLQER
jgi:MmeI, N-terminal domain